MYRQFSSVVSGIFRKGNFDFSDGNLSNINNVVLEQCDYREYKYIYKPLLYYKRDPFNTSVLIVRVCLFY